MASKHTPLTCQTKVDSIILVKPRGPRNIGFTGPLAVSVRVTQLGAGKAEQMMSFVQLLYCFLGPRYLAKLLVQTQKLGFMVDACIVIASCSLCSIVLLCYTVGSVGQGCVFLHRTSSSKS